MEEGGRDETRRITEGRTVWGVEESSFLLEDGLRGELIWEEGGSR